MIQLPSFNDSHLHVLGLGYKQTIIDLSSYTSIKDITKISSEKPFIIGQGWHQENFTEKRLITKQDLNKISQITPVIFYRVCGHVLVCNDVALELAKKTQKLSNENNGTSNFDTGIFTEEHMRFITAIIPPPTKNDIKKMFVKANDLLVSLGITALSSDDFSIFNVPYELVIEALVELYDEHKMDIHLTEQVNLPTIELLEDYINKGYHQKHYKGFSLGPLKLLADGSLGGNTAFLSAPYEDDKNTKGIAVFTQETLDKFVYLADYNHMDVAIHAIGDQMVGNVITSIERALEKTQRVNHRHAIIHAQLATRQQIKRMAKLNIAAIVQPIFLNSDVAIIEKKLGLKRAKESYLFKTMLKEGVSVGFSTDAPVEPVNPFLNIQIALTSHSIKYPTYPPFNTKEVFTLEEALTCYTTNNYKLTNDQKPDNYIVIDKDIFNVDPYKIKDITVLETVINGKTVYKKNKKIS
ncbi:MAG: amidohydrolase [Candidatus Izimaplasma sp.]|nr:amidohydrolase [Candidatus Izimaplasma bacterium]